MICLAMDQAYSLGSTYFRVRYPRYTFWILVAAICSTSLYYLVALIGPFLKSTWLNEMDCRSDKSRAYSCLSLSSSAWTFCFSLFSIALHRSSFFSFWAKALALWLLISVTTRSSCRRITLDGLFAGDPESSIMTVAELLWIMGASLTLVTKRRFRRSSYIRIIGDSLSLSLREGAFARVGKRIFLLGPAYDELA